MVKQNSLVGENWITHVDHEYVIELKLKCDELRRGCISSKPSS